MPLGDMTADRTARSGEAYLLAVSDTGEFFRRHSAADGIGSETAAAPGDAEATRDLLLADPALMEATSNCSARNVLALIYPASVVGDTRQQTNARSSPQYS